MDENTLPDLQPNPHPQTIEEILDAYGYPCRRIAMNILAGEREAELCVREAAGQTLAHPGSVPSGADLCMQRLTRKIALERYMASQSAKRGYNLFSTIIDELGECFPASTTPVTAEERVGDHLNRFLGKKSRETRDIFICRYFYAESLTEIARRFGMREPLVKSRLRKTNKQLAAFWAQEAGDCPPLTYPALLLGLNHADDALILSAHGSSKRMRRLIPWAVAACAVALLAVSFPYLREVINTDLILRDPDWDKENDQEGDAEIAHKPDEDSILGIGSFASLGTSTLRLTDVTETTVTLTLIKNDDTPLYAAVYDRLGDALACTDPTYKVDGAVIRHGRIKIYADGSDTPATELPTAPGRYTLVVDFASIRNGTYPMQDYIGFFANIGKNGAPVTVYFSLKVPEETTTEDATDHTEEETAEDTSETRP